ncbi:MAG: hypothetical protein ACLP8S_04465 [Solirubrobacteraceae bacterium]
MTDPPPGGSVFNIGSQHAGEIYQAAGDQTIYHAGGLSSVDFAKAMSELRTAVAGAAGQLSEGERRQAEQMLGTVDSELRRSEPSRERIATALGKVATILKRAGRLADTIGAFHQLAAILGPAAVGLIGLIA